MILLNVELASPSLNVNYLSKELSIDPDEQIGNQNITVQPFTLTWSLNPSSNVTSFAYIASLVELNLGSNPDFYMAFAFSKDQYMVRT